MLQKSLKLLAAAFLVALALTLSYALSLGGPEDELRDAEAQLARGEPARAVALLDFAERSARLMQQRELRLKLLRLRLEAHRQLGNAPLALADLERLLREGDAAPELRLEHIRLLAVVGQADRAFQLAEEFLREQPDDGRGLELAGEAAQSRYRDDLRSALGGVETDVGRRDAARARTALLAYLYRPEGDDEVPQSLAALGAVYKASSQLLAQWPSRQRQLIALRGRIQTALGYFQRSLEAGGEPVAAFRGMALSLDQAARTDDLLLHCEAYRRRFDHRYVLEAGAISCWTLVQRGCLDAALAAAGRWLPADAIEQRIAARRFDSGLDDLLAARSAAAWRLRDKQRLGRFGSDAWRLLQAGAPVQFANALNNAYSQLLNDRPEADNALRAAIYFLTRRAAPIGQVDLVAELHALRCDLLRRRGAAAEEIVAVHRDWIALQPGELAPVLALADHQLAAGQSAAAMATLERAADLSPYDETVFERRLAAARALHRDTERDGPGLLAQCRKRRVLVPEVDDPLGLVLCAEAALASGEPALTAVTIACARAAIDRFPWAATPRRLEAGAHLQAGRPAAAARALEKLLLRDDVDATTLKLAVTAQLAEGARLTAPQDAGATLFAALQRRSPDSDLSTAVLLHVPPAARAAAAPFARLAVRAADAPPPLRALAAACFAAAGDLAAADAELTRLAASPASVDDNQRTHLATAVAGRLLADRQRPDTELAKAAEQYIARFGLHSPAAAPALLAAGLELRLERPLASQVLFTTGLAHAAPEARTGSHFVAAGDLALRAGSRPLAAQHWTAALAFADGRSAVEPLVRLCLAEGQSERAQQVYGLVESPTDPALAVRFGLRTQRSPGELLARQRLAADRTDLVGNLVLVAIGLPAAAVLPPLEEPQLDSMLEAAALCDVPELAAAALPLTHTLAAAVPDALPLQLLHAQTLLAAGQREPAARRHAALFARFGAEPLLLGAAARAARLPGYSLDAAVADAIRAAVANGALAGCPAARSFAMHAAATAVVQAGDAALAQRLATDMWVTAPRETGASLSSAEAVAARGDPLSAWWIVERLGDAVPAADRPRALALQAGWTTTVLQTRPELAELFFDSALRAVEAHGPQGSVVHLVLDLGQRLPARRLGEARELELLTAHLQAAALGGDDPLLPRTVQRLAAAAGAVTTLGHVDAALRANPTCLPLWLARAELLRLLQRGPEGIAALRSVLRHAEAPQLRIEFTIAAARQFALDADDLRQFAALPATLLEQGPGILARGLVALRTGRPDEAATLLARAEPRPDGLHLAALAQAWLQGSASDGVLRAAAACASLATDHASSSLARYAGSLARQLSPRSASAPASPTNR